MKEKRGTLQAPFLSFNQKMLGSPPYDGKNKALDTSHGLTDAAPLHPFSPLEPPSSLKAEGVKEEAVGSSLPTLPFPWSPGQRRDPQQGTLLLSGGGLGPKSAPCPPASFPGSNTGEACVGRGMSGRIPRRIRQKALFPDQHLLEITDLGSQEALAFPDGSLAMIPPGRAGWSPASGWSLSPSLSRAHVQMCAHRVGAVLLHSSPSPSRLGALPLH